METKEIDGVLYELVPEEKKKSCRGCAFYGPDGSVCTTLTDNCNKGFIYKEIDKPISTSNLKPFNLEEAKAGKPICTRNGKKVRIVCFNRKSNIGSIIALVSNQTNDEEECYTYHDNGRFCEEVDDIDDLMMLPEKKEGWMNIYSNGNNHRVGSPIYNSEEEALCNKTSNAIDTVKIEWRE